MTSQPSTTLKKHTTGTASIARWKFEAPRLSGQLLARGRLLTKIEDHLGRAKSSGDVFLLSAPAGFGKSTLLAQWADTRSLPVAWYHLDVSDADPAVCLAGIAQALRTRLPRAHWEIVHVLRRLHTETLSPLDVRRATAVLARDIRQNVTRPLALVLTNLDDIGTRSGGHSVLDQLLARPADHLRLVIESREPPQLRISPLLVQRRFAGIGAEDLRLRADEFDALLALLEATPTRDEREAIQALCDGWVTGVVLATGALSPAGLALQPPVAFETDAVDRAAIFDYLAAEVIETLPATLSEFAAEAAILPYMTPSLCAALLQHHDARERLGALERRMGFMTRTGDRPGEPRFRFQPVLRQALLVQLEATPGGRQRIQELRAHAGLLLEEQGDYEEAAHQYAALGIQTGEYDRLVALIEARCGALLRAGRGATLARWLDLLPSAIREERMYLQVLRAELHRQAGRPVEAFAAAERACARLLPQTDADPTLAARALVVRAEARFDLGQYAAARTDCERALGLAPLDADEPRISARFALAACLIKLESPAAAAECLSAVEERAQRQRDLWALARLFYLRSKLWLEDGAYARAEEAATTGLRYAQEADSEIDSINLRLNLGAIKYRTGRTAAAREDFEVASAQAHAACYSRGEVYALANLGNLEVMLGHLGAAQTAYQQVLALLAEEDDTHLRTEVYRGLAYALVLAGDARQAIELLTKRGAARADAIYTSDAIVLALPLGVALARSGDLAEAERVLIECGEVARAHQMYADLARSQLYLSAVRLAQGRLGEIDGLLGSALDLAVASDGVAVLRLEVLLVPEVLPLLARLSHPLAALLGQGSGGDQMRIGIGRAPALNVPEPLEGAGTAGDGALPPISVCALGEARVFVGTTRITHWRIPASQELLFYLLDHQMPVSKDVILNDLWPEKDAQTAENNFRQARFHLKKSLGRACVEQKNGRWYLTISCSLDTAEFERLIDEGERLADEGHLTAAAVALRQALTYWTGEYLEDNYSEWSGKRREKLAQHHMRCLERLADLETRLGRHREAAQLWHDILDIEPLYERAHRGIMAYSVARGELAQAITQYKRCARALHEHLGATPGAETKALYQAVLAKMQSRAAPTAATAR